MKPATKRIRRTPEDARETILAVARARLLAHGLDGLKIADIAADAGISHATLIHHFGSSAGMRRALVERMANELLGEFVAVVETHPATPALRGEMLAKLFATLGDDRHTQLFAWLALEGADEDEPSPFDAETEALLETFLARIVGQTALPAPERQHARFGIALAITSAIGLGIASGWLGRMHLLEDDERRRFTAWLAELLGGQLRGPRKDA